MVAAIIVVVVAVAGLVFLTAVVVEVIPEGEVVGVGVSVLVSVIVSRDGCCNFSVRRGCAHCHPLMVVVSVLVVTIAVVHIGVRAGLCCCSRRN